MSVKYDNHIAISRLFERARTKTELDTASQTHLAGCDFCRERLSWMESASALGAKETSYEPPKTLMDNVLGLGRASRLKQLRNFIVASLTFDSFKDLASLPVRAEGVAARQMTYEAEEFEIGLWLRWSEDRTLTLTGQVLSKTGAPIKDSSAQVDLVIDGDHIKTSSLSPWGEFSFPDLPQTKFGLQVSFMGRVLRIPSILLVDEEGS
ncbi:MAG TPA: carboxypeptidase-like regulatory domain-containing protein [Terriglobia bacterium]|nr:carboxypeptidase-like regulatory domain-containing protein [Terriglobia bacterium]